MRTPRLLDLGGDGLVQGIQDPLGALYGDVVILVPLVAGDEGLAHSQALGEFPLGETLRDPQGDQQPADLGQPREDRELAAAHALVPLHFLSELRLERPQRAVVVAPGSLRTPRAGPAGAGPG